jgi:hypothetical protein
MAAAEEEYPSTRVMCQFVGSNGYILDRKLQSQILGIILAAVPETVHDNRSGADIDLDLLAAQDLKTLRDVYNLVKARRDELGTKLV